MVVFGGVILMEEHFLILVLKGPRLKKIPYSLTSLTLLYLPHCPGESHDSAIKITPPNLRCTKRASHNSGHWKCIEVFSVLGS